MASTPTATKRMTYAEWEALPEETGGLRHELIDGVHVVSPSAVPFHEVVTVCLIDAMGDAVRPGRLGQRFTAPTDVKLAADRVVVPDLCFVRRDRVHIVGPKALEGPPDLVIEILSPSTRSYDQTRKLALYEEAGVPELWFVDAKTRGIVVHLLEHGRYRATVYGDGDTVRSTVLPKLFVDVTDLFSKEVF